MRHLARFAAPIGLLLIVSGGIAYNIRPDLKAWIGGIPLLGAVLVLVSLYRSFGDIKAWLNRCWERPAAKRARAMRES